MQILGKKILEGFPMNINLVFWGMAFLSAGNYCIVNEQIIRDLCLSIRVILTLVAGVPSLFGAIVEAAKMGKPLKMDWSKKTLLT